MIDTKARVRLVAFWNVSQNPNMICILNLTTHYKVLDRTSEPCNTPMNGNTVIKSEGAYLALKIRAINHMHGFIAFSVELLVLFCITDTLR